MYCQQCTVTALLEEFYVKTKLFTGFVVLMPNLF